MGWGLACWSSAGFSAAGGGGGGGESLSGVLCCFLRLNDFFVFFMKEDVVHFDPDFSAIAAGNTQLVANQLVS